MNGYRETNGVPIINTGGTYWLDPNDSFANKYSKTNPQADGSWLIQQTDHPGSGLMMSETSVNDQFKDYFQYLPPGNDSITVTLGSVEWSWGFIAQYTNNSWTVTPSNLSSGSYQDDDTFPEWTGIVPGQTDF